MLIFIQQEEEKKKKEEREKASLERKYALPDNPVIIVHPNSVAKGGKFDCSLMSLSVLLDYRPEDNKEHSFEVRKLFGNWFYKDVVSTQLTHSDVQCTVNKKKSILWVNFGITCNITIKIIITNL